MTPAAVLVAPTEPPILRAVGASSSVPEQYGCDLLIGAQWGLVGVQRKTFPEDLVASLNDDRFARLVRKLDGVAVRFLVLEGTPVWTQDGWLVHDRHHLSRKSLWGLLASLSALYGVATLWTRDLPETVALVEYLATWAAKEAHGSVLARPGPPKSTWGDVGDQTWAEFILQGVDGIGPALARRIIHQFGRVPLVWSVSPEELLTVPGLGPGRLKKMLSVIPPMEGDGNARDDVPGEGPAPEPV